MKKSNVVKIDNFEKQQISQFAESAYLNYSMYVILDRALPHIADGLKPVQRRIIYAMSELGLSNNAKYKKSARTVGDVLGKFHPHGDSACYEAMVLMAQSFSYRYPLVDGQGNWGSPDDPKSFAAMRYTEAKLSKFASVLLSELGQGTVDFAPNFDGTLEEPRLLPARLPNLLLNGASGIAVGMATDIPPHNLTEVTTACIHLLDNPKAGLKDICEIIQGPDYPTDAEIITPKSEIIRMYETGNGSLRVRSVYKVEDGDIVLTALPPQTSPSKILEQIAAQMQAKKLPFVADLRDESDHENPTRLVIIPKSNRVDIPELMGHLFATTDLERTYRVNLNIIGLDGKPRVKNLVELLNEWLVFRKDTVVRRLQYRLDKVTARLHILEGLLIAFLNIDEVIHIIRTQENPKAKLIQKFKLSDIQAEAILELKLRHLAKLEEMQIKGESKELAEEKAELEDTLGSDKKLKALMKKELKEDLKTFGDARRTKIVHRAEAQKMTLVQKGPVEPISIIFSSKGWIRQAKGHDFDGASLPYKSGDEFKMQLNGKTDDTIVFMDSTGRSYSTLASGLPTSRGHGEPLTSKFTPPPGAVFETMLLSDPKANVFLCSNYGYGFITTFEDLITKNKTGKANLNLSEGASLLTATLCELEKTRVVMITNDGRLLIFDSKEVPHLSKGKGQKLISIPADKLKSKEEFVQYALIMPAKASLLIICGKKKVELKARDLDQYLSERGRRGNKLPKGAQKVTGVEVI